METDVMSSGTVDLSDITKEAATLKKQLEALEAEEKSLKEKYTAACAEILKTLELMGLDSIKAHGYTFFKEVKSSVQTPKTVEAKKQLFEFLESKGIFMEMVSVNSQTLNSLYKSLADEALQAGNIDFTLPGVEAPTPYTTLKLRKA